MIYALQYPIGYPFVFNLEGQLMNQKCSLRLESPPSFDLYQNNFYFIDGKQVTRTDLDWNILFTFPIPNSYDRSLKVNDDLIYVTISTFQQVFIYLKEGKIKSTIGSAVSEKNSKKIG